MYKAKLFYNDMKKIIAKSRTSFMAVNSDMEGEKDILF